MRSLNQMRRDARAIFLAGVEAVDPSQSVRRSLRREDDFIEVAGAWYDLRRYHNIYVVGAGKASAKMAAAVEELLGDRIHSGFIITKDGHLFPTKRIQVIEAGHPLPDKRGAAGVGQIVELLNSASADDLVFVLISGGGSALLPCPADGIALEDEQDTTRLLLGCGATIQEINAIRKHLSKVKGGRLAQLAHPATVISLILSDVVGDPLENIASGPTVPDTSTFSDSLRIIDRYHLTPKISPAIRNFLERGSRGELEETPKASSSIFGNVQNVIIGNNHLALGGAKGEAEALGYRTLLLSSFISGEAKTVAEVHAAVAEEIIATGNPVGRPACVISGGETTVTIHGEGTGGRNQEFALAAAKAIDGMENVVILSGGTDGTDGPTDAAGAIVDGGTVQRGKNAGLDAADHLDRNDSYHFLQLTGDLLITGPTLTNVMDLRLVLVA